MPAAVQGTSVAAPRELPLHRRLGRRALRSLRPLAAPFLHRLDLRTRYSVDRSEMSQTLHRIEGRSASSAASLEAALAAVARSHASIAREHGARIEAIAESVTHVADAISRVKSAMSHVESRLSTAVETLDLRLSETEPRVLNQVRALLDERFADPLKRFGHIEARAELLVRYSELLLQRNVMPLGQDLAVRTEAGYLLVPMEDPALLVAMVETRGKLEPGTLRVLSSLLHTDSFLIDVGAHIGTLTLPLARIVGPRGRVLALEPAPRTADLLQRTLSMNEVSPWVDIRVCAAGSTEGTARFAISERSGHNSLFPPPNTVQTIDVSVCRLDDLVSPGTRVDVVKIDAEGAELEVLRGMQRIVADNPKLAIVLEFGPEHLQRSGTSVQGWFAEATQHGHRVWEIDETTTSLRPLRQSGLEEIFSMNVLLVHDDPRDHGLLAS